MKIVVFGIGNYYKNRAMDLKRLHSHSEIVCFADNRANEIRFFENKRVLLPEELKQIDFDAVLIMTLQFSEVRAQLINLGFPENLIFSYEEFKPRLMQGRWEIYKVCKSKIYKKKILIFTADLSFNGGSIAALNAAIEIAKRGYYVAIAVAEISNKYFIYEINKNNIDVIVMKSFPYIGGLDFEIINTFDMVISNVFQTINCVYMCSKNMPVFWWIHENPDGYDSVYDRIRRQFKELDYSDWMKNVNIGAVSIIAKKAFENHYPQMVNYLLPFGVPDEAVEDVHNGNNLIFAVIGLVSPRKAQDTFLEAAEMLINSIEYNCEFWVIGAEPNDDYTISLKEKYATYEQIKFLGEKNREEMKELYSQIDVVVCSSIMETMSVVVIEGMMNSKVCITTDATGIADYIDDRVNGLVCKSKDGIDLFEKMKWVIDHPKECEQIKRKARETYERNFSMDIFGDRLEKVINETIEMFSAQKQ